MQDEKTNNNQPVILNLNPVNENISQFIQLQSGILSESEIYVPSDSILPVGTRIKIEYRLKSFGQKENVKIIDALAEVVGAEVDSEKGRRGVRAKFLKLSPTSQILIQKLLEKIRASKPQSGEKKITSEKQPEPAAPTVKVEEPKIKIEEPKTTVEEPKVKIEEPKVEVQEPKETVSEPTTTPSLAEIMAQHEPQPKKEEVSTESKPSTLAEIMSREMEKPRSGEIASPDDKQAQYIFEYLPPGQPLEENTGIVKIREIIRSTDVSSVRRTSRLWLIFLIFIVIIGGAIGFFYMFPQYAPKIFVRSHEVSNVITKQDLTPENIQAQPQIPVQKEEKKEEVKAPEKQEEMKVNETATKEEKKEPEAKKQKVVEPDIQPLTLKAVEEKQKKGEGVKIITKAKIKKEEEKEKKVSEEKAKKIQEEKGEKEKAKIESEKTKAKKEAASAEPGKIIVQITPTDADLTVFIDGAQAGTMPTLTKQLPPGAHTIRVTADGYNEEVRKVEIQEGETKTVKINLKEK